MTTQKGEPLDDLSLSPTVLDAMAMAWASGAEGGPIGTLDVLLAILSVDFTWGWEAVQIEAGFITEADLERYQYPDPRPNGTWNGFLLSISTTQALKIAANVASRYEIAPIPTGVLALGMLADPRSAATAALLARAEIDHQRLLELVQENVLGTRLEGLDLSPPTADAKPRLIDAPGSETALTPASKPRRLASALGFNLGTFLGAFAVSSIGGLPLVSSLGLAFVVRTASVQARRRRRDRLLASIAAVGLMVALVLAVTAVTGFGDERRAVAKLDAARSEIDEDKLVAAMKHLGGAGLLADESASITVLASCVDWALGFKDYALFEAQVALDFGYDPEAETHFRGRDCYLDTARFFGLGFVHVFQYWFLYPLPDGDDAEGRRLLKIAENMNTSRQSDRVTALGCLANRYDMRSLAGFDFTVGLNENLRHGAEPTPFPAIKRCLDDKKMQRRYLVHLDPMTGIEEFTPTDASDRIPSPQRHVPPDVCWARFPTGGPCGVDG